MLAQTEQPLTRMAKIKSPLHDIPAERHQAGQLDRAAGIAELSDWHLWEWRVLTRWTDVVLGLREMDC